MLRITMEVKGIPAEMELVVKEDFAMKVEEWYGKTEYQTVRIGVLSS